MSLTLRATSLRGRECRWGRAVWKHGRRVSADRYRGRAGRVLAGHAGLVRGGVRRADAGPGRSLAGHRQGRGYAGRRADRVGQDAGRVPVGDRQAGGGAAAAGPEATDPGALRLPAQGAGGGHRAEPAGPADRDPARRAPAGAGRAGHPGRGPAPATPRPRTAGSWSPSRPTSSSPRPSRCSCCSRRRPGRPCAAWRRSSSTRCTRWRATSAARTWRCRWSGWTRCASLGTARGRPSGSVCRRPFGRWRRWPRSWAAPGR